MPYKDLRQFLERLQSEGELHTIKAEVDWNLEIGAITRRAIEMQLPAILFENVKDYPGDYRVLGNLLTATKPVAQGRLAIALDLPKDTPPSEIIESFRQRMQNRIKPRIVHTGPCKENILIGEDIDLWKYPTPLMHSGDGGRYIGTWHITITQDPEDGWVNWGIYRHMIHDRNTMSVLSFPPQHGGTHHAKYESRGEPMPIAVAIGTEPVCNIAADTQLPAGEDEADLAGGLRGEPVELVKCETNDLFVPATSEIVIEGFVRPKERKDDGPFGEYAGYLGREAVNVPIIDVTCITHRNSPILTVSNMGKPWDEAGIISSVAVSAIVGSELKKKNIAYKAVYCPPPDFGVIISVKPQYVGYAHTVASTVWGSKVGIHRPFIIVVEDDVDVTNLEDVYWCLVTRMNPERNIHIQRNAPGHSLFPFLSVEERAARRGSRVLFDATFPVDIDSPVVIDFEHGWSAEIQQLVISRWMEYGFEV
ncbi:MAG: UbiD family decarboxylase [Anaerolineales bacterium]|nr:UbiD family decarboxylase [Anaerolineales bacterium]